MTNYLFLFGRDPELSFLEMLSYFENNETDFKIVVKEKGYVIVESNELKCDKIINDLGGAVKIGKIIMEDLKDFDDKVNEINFDFNSNRVWYSIFSTEKNIDVEKYNRLLKTKLKGLGYKAIKKKSKRFGVEPTKFSKIKNDGIELIFVKRYVAKVLETADLSFNKILDNRPYKDFKKTTSSRLAKILINLGMVKKSETLLDPFCGSGVILINALIKGINVIGVDNNRESINGTRANLDWVKKEFNVDNKYRLFFGDARKLHHYVKKNDFDVVVSEPYLGPFFKKLPDKKEVLKIIKNVEGLYYQFLKNLRSLVPRGKRVVLIFPRYITNKNEIFDISNRKIIKEAGFRVVKDPILYVGNEKRLLRWIFVLV